MTDTEAAYIAGIIDGEGSITISRTRNITYTSGYRERVLVSVGNTDQRLGDYLVKTCGGNIQVRTEGRKNTNCKPLYVWQIFANSIVALLEMIMPHLVLKKEQAEIAICFQKRRNNKVHLSDADREIDAKDRELIRALNKRGLN